MQNNDMILCVCSAYEGKYYFNSRYAGIPEVVKEELQIMCVLYTEEVGGEIYLTFSEEGKLLIHVSADENDLLFDEIGSELKIKQMRTEKRELFSQLEEYYKAFFMNN